MAHIGISDCTGPMKTERIFGWLSKLNAAEPKDDIYRHTAPNNKVEGRNQESSGGQAVSVLEEWSSRRGEHQANLELEPSEKQSLLSKYAARIHGHTKKEKNGYRRIPRSKPKDDHYEYKGKSSRVEDAHSPKTKKKSVRQKRKHTINETFRAPNVPRSRLTLPSSMGLGIFKKGKASTPVNTCEVPDRGFSEMDFLCNASPRTQKNISIQIHKREDITKARRSSDSHPTGLSDRVLPDGYSISDKLDRMPEAHKTDPDLDHQAEGVGNGRQSLHLSAYTFLEDEESNKCLLSPKNYLRNITNSKGMRPEVYFELYTMQLLEFNLNAPSEYDAPDSTKKYWTLDELKGLLEKRILLQKTNLECSSSEFTTQLSQAGSRKRKRDSTSKMEADPDEPPIKKRKCDTEKRIRSTTKSRSTTVSKSTISSHQATTFDQSPLNNGAIDITQHTQPLVEDRFEQHVWSRDTPEHRHFPDDYFTFGEDENIVSQAFDVAYDAIMHSDWSIPYDLPKHVALGINNTNSKVETTSTPKLFSKWGTRGERLLHHAPIGQEFVFPCREDERQLLDVTAMAYKSYQPLFFGQASAEREVLESPRGYLVQGSKGTSCRNSSETTALYMSADETRNFWRQNKLY